VCRLVALAAVAVTLGAIEICLLFAGYTLFMRTWSCFQSIAHFCGLLFVALFMDAHWRYDSLAAIFALCSVLPCVIESTLATLAARFSLQRW
jgi:Transmembrane protein